MSAIQGPTGSTPPPAGPDAAAGGIQQKPSDSKEARENGQMFDKALGQKGGKEAVVEGQQKQSSSPEDLLRRAHSGKQEQGESDAMGKNAMANHAMAAHAPAEGIKGAPPPTVAASQAADSSQMVEKMNAVADKIMVSTAADVKAVKVNFNNNVLPGTEVMIRKDGAGQLSLEFTTTSTDSFNLISRGEQALVETLNRKMGSEVSIDIKMQGRDGDSDTGDGRSREQYVSEDDPDTQE